MIRLRLAPLRAAVVLMLGFVLLRVVYRVTFGGAGGGAGAPLLDLPAFRLDGPFSHITLFGPITMLGLGHAALSALPIAAVIVFFGLLNAVFNVQALFARGAGRGPLRAISRSLVIAWATFPALLESVRRVRIARALRGERSIASLLVPIFEQTIERALALAASMETRGFAATRVVAGVCEAPVVLRDASLNFGADWHLDDLDVTLRPGTLTVIVGATGSGKTSLLHSMSGLFQHFYDGVQHGSIDIAGTDRAATPPRDTAGFVGLVAQNVRLGFAAETVHDEIGFALAVRNVAPSIVHARVLEVAARLQIEHLVDRKIEQLSAGEASLVAIAAAIVNHPILLLVDEPLADLDTSARDRVCTVLGRLAHEAGVCVVIAEHNTREFESIADVWLRIRGHHLHELDPADIGTTMTPGRDAAANDRRAADSWRAALPSFRGAADIAAAVQGSAWDSDTVRVKPLAGIRHLSVRHGTDLAVDDVSFEVQAGEVVALRGSNGAGKSSLLRAIALPQAADIVIVAGRDVHSLQRRTRRRAVALVPENFDDLLFAITVDEECRRADRALRRLNFRRTAPTVPESRTATLFACLLGFDKIADAAPLLQRHPRDLSAGERLCLVMAIQLAARPALLLVDEPTRGLDHQARALVSAALLTAAGQASAVVFATHDDDFARGLATRTLHMEAGRLTSRVEVLS